MHHKNIKLIIRRQLKKQFSNWKRLGKKQKKDIASKVLAEVVAEYDFKQVVDAPKEELLGIEEQLPKGIIKLDEMARYIDMVNENRIIKFNSYKRSPIYIKDEELAFVDGLIDDVIINRILSYDGYRPGHAESFPGQPVPCRIAQSNKVPRDKLPQILHRRVSWSGSKTEPCIYWSAITQKDYDRS